MSYYRYHVFFCTNQRANCEACCQQYDAQAMRDYAKQKIKQKGLSEAGMVRINNAGCLNRCAEGPVLVVYPDAVWYTWVDQDDIDEIIDSHLEHGNIVERLRLPG